MKIDMKEMYGVEELSFEEEIELVKNHPDKARTRSSKIVMQNNLNVMQRQINEYREKFKRIPEEDDEKHAELVARLADEINSCMVRFISAYDAIART